jgi:hypothetical protein
MGAIQSRAKENETLKRYAEWTREQADNLTNRYKALDLEFGLDMDSLSQLLEDETTAAEAMQCFGRGNGTVNALEILVAVCMVAQGTEDQTLRSIFIVFDFGGIGSTSYDEFAILCLVAARVLVLIAKADTKSEPSDQLIDQLVRTKFAPTDRVELEQCMSFCTALFPVDTTTKERTFETLLKPFEIPLANDAAELGALLGGTLGVDVVATDIDTAPEERLTMAADASGVSGAEVVTTAVVAVADTPITTSATAAQEEVPAAAAAEDADAIVEDTKEDSLKDTKEETLTAEETPTAADAAAKVEEPVASAE